MPNLEFGSKERKHSTGKKMLSEGRRSTYSRDQSSRHSVASTSRHSFGVTNSQRGMNALSKRDLEELEIKKKMKGKLRLALQTIDSAKKLEVTLTQFLREAQVCGMVFSNTDVEIIRKAFIVRKSKNHNSAGNNDNHIFVNYEKIIKNMVP